MNKRKYPLFMIDRSKDESYPFDYITCLDRESGFVARVINLHTDQLLKDFSDQVSQIDGSDYTSCIMRHRIGGTVLVIEEFLYDTELTESIKARIKTLMKKGIKKYFFATIDREPNRKDYGIDNQIAQPQLTIERAQANFPELLRRAPNKETALYNMALSEAILDTLKRYKQLTQDFAQLLN